jgi:hypothetical protein
MGQLQKHNLQADVPKAHVSHRVEGRARLRIPSRRGDHAFFERLKEQTGELSRVISTEVNARTGGVLIRHVGPLESITEECRQRGLFDLESIRPFEQPVVERVRDQLATLDAAVRGTTAGPGEYVGDGLSAVHWPRRHPARPRPNTRPCDNVDVGGHQRDGAQLESGKVSSPGTVRAREGLSWKRTISLRADDETQL